MEQVIPVNLDEFNRLFADKCGVYRRDCPSFRSCTIQTKAIAKLKFLLPIPPQNVEPQLNPNKMNDAVDQAVDLSTAGVQVSDQPKGGAQSCQKFVQTRIVSNGIHHGASRPWWWWVAGGGGDCGGGGSQWWGWCRFESLYKTN
jgi:hypothetical protein